MILKKNMINEFVEMYTTTKSENNEQSMQQKLETFLQKYVIVRPSKIIKNLCQARE